MKLRVTIDSQTFEVEVGDINARPVLVSVEGTSFEVWPEEPYSPKESHPAVIDLAEAQASLVTGPAGAQGGVEKTQSVLAPIPGVILAVSVKTGDQVEFGQELCVLEAMKMKNQIRANRSGKIRTVCIEPGEQVRHNQVLMEYAG